MLNEYKATLKNGQITWLDTPPNNDDVYEITIIVDKQPTERKLGFMRGEIKVPDDINFADDEVAKLFGVELS